MPRKIDREHVSAAATQPIENGVPGCAARRHTVHEDYRRAFTPDPSEGNVPAVEPGGVMLHLTRCQVHACRPLTRSVASWRSCRPTRTSAAPAVR